MWIPYKKPGYGSTRKPKKVWRVKKQLQECGVASLGPPSTFHATADYLISSPTSNSFTVPNSLTDCSTDSGRLVRNSLFVHDSISDFNQINLSEGGSRIKDEPNAGGNSVASEALSYDILRCMHGAELLCTEMQLEYWPQGGKITDYSVRLYGLHIGVSVTRAMKYGGIFDREDAKKLLEKKLNGVNVSSRLVMQKFHKQILHIFAEREYVADVLAEVYESELSPELKSSTLVCITVCNNADWIFRNKKSKDLCCLSM
eukprot:TRINITY_DN1814_c0_g1_i1.p1 TRINITY_DN1814_c0_g1~~TRINITY_DN1814_c0_g1_i1.p1  ORF type:complete len:258 (+),score=21.50 TRINITY_DN1814_c0_g1_i1:440-1213(+)